MTETGKGMQRPNKKIWNPRHVKFPNPVSNKKLQFRWIPHRGSVLVSVSLETFRYIRNQTQDNSKMQMDSMYVWMHVCMYVCVHACMPSCTYVCVCMSVYTYSDAMSACSYAILLNACPPSCTHVLSSIQVWPHVACILWFVHWCIICIFLKADVHDEWAVPTTHA